jgi:hypothetical protein
MGPETHEQCVHNQRTAIRQHLQALRAYVLQAAHSEVCTTCIRAILNNQDLEAR